jgi:hypothetical protein
MPRNRPAIWQALFGNCCEQAFNIAAQFDSHWSLLGDSFNQRGFTFGAITLTLSPCYGQLAYGQLEGLTKPVLSLSKGSHLTAFGGTSTVVVDDGKATCR